MAEVTFRNVFKDYKEVKVVKDFNLKVNDKEFLVLVGPSGCGKTTCLRMLAGLEEITKGEILIGDRIVNDVSPKDRDIAMVFQNYALYPHMSVFDNMAFALKLRKMPKPKIKAKVEETAEFLGLSEYLQRKPKQLSGGQRQRVALGRAIVREPKVFLMDEPLSNLDAKMRVSMRSELIKLHRKLGITTIYVTHDQTEAMTMGDRIAVMNDGILQQLDTPLNIYNNPANVFVAGFIGTPAMNFIDAQVEKTGDEVFFNINNEFKLLVPADKAAAVESYAGKKVIFGIRPEHIYDAALDGLVKPTDTNTATVKVDVSEPMGNIVVMYLNAGNIDITATIDSETQAKDGSVMKIIFDMEKAHAFDADTKVAIF
ncbi:MAG: sn-glycerol-3-phosphate ABC transporter ATP-binding protein UgpC [Abditibacteriota bacterium]|nr:sn-glycerol-3-phosphate ABC transporter ATP-binding protein UgpC [Abditibacteriota bacterium]